MSCICARSTTGCSTCLAENGRAGWFEEEMADLVDPAIYRSEPARGVAPFFRIRGPAPTGAFLGVLRAVGGVGAKKAAQQQRDLPRGRIMAR